jgi:RNA polymerase sigma-70 factor (ECF subfamily)
MPEPELNTARLHQCVDRLRAGDRAGADDLFRAAGRRLNLLARRMLAGFPAVRSQADTADVAQGAAMRLLNALRDLRPASTRDFVSLAALQIRRELLDLARKVRRPTTPDRVPDPVAPAASPDDLDLWTRFHEAVEGLPVEEREAVGLIFYHGRTRVEAAEVLGVSERTVYRWWEGACRRLNDRLEGQLPLT